MKTAGAYVRLFAQARKREGENIPVLAMVFRLIFWLLKYRSGVVTFFVMNLHKKGSTMRTILTHNRFMRIHNRLNPEYYRVILEDKYIFYQYFRNSGFPVVEIKGLIENGHIKRLDANKTEPFDNIVNYNLNCYIKKHSSWGGNQIYKLEIQEKRITLNHKPSDINEIRRKVTDHIFIMQDTIVQHPELDRLNPSCVNTLRLITIHNGQRVENFSNMLRIGVKNSLVDNLSQGGLGCTIHSNGTLHETAYDKCGINKWITHHPDSNVAFDEFKIPFYKEALDLVIKMHETFLCLFIIGWDVAITETGPVVLEGNPLGEVMYLQSFYGKGIRDIFIPYSRSFRKAKASLLN